MNNELQIRLFSQLSKDMGPMRAEKVCKDTLEALKYLKEQLQHEVDLSRNLSRVEVEEIWYLLENDLEYKRLFRGKRQHVRCGIVRLESIYEKLDEEFFSDDKTMFDCQLERDFGDEIIIDENREIDFDKEGYLSFTMMHKLVKEKGVSKNALLKYLVEDKKYISDIRTITEKGLEGGVVYRYLDDSTESKWPVYSVRIQEEVLNDAEALVEGIKQRKVGAACLDVYEEESNVFFHDYSNHIVDDDTLARLISMPNVIVTSHQAFLTEEALTNIADTTLDNVKEFFVNDYSKNEICYKCPEVANCRQEHSKKCF